MSQHNSHYPGRMGGQITWLNNRVGKVGQYQAAPGYVAGDIAANHKVTFGG